MENSMKDTNNITRGQIWFGILLIIILIFGYVLAEKFILTDNKTQINEEIKESVDNLGKSLTPYEQKNSYNKLVIGTNFENSANNNSIKKDLRKEITSNGNISSGFLYIVASVDDKALNEYSDVYTKIGANVDGRWVESGGHLIENRSLETPKSTDQTELLFKLSDVKYKISFQDSDIDVHSGNWLKIINSSNISFMTAFSSTEGKGKIKEISIFYECAEGTSCSLEVN